MRGFLATIALAAAATALRPEGYVPVPGAGYMREDCVWRVPSGTRAARADALRGGSGMAVTFLNGTVAWLRCPELDSAGRPRRALPADYDGWEAYTVFNYSAGLDVFLGQFTVPRDSPAQSPDVLYLFTGLQNINWIPKVDPEPTQDFDIIQPVLQYPGDFGAYWSVRSWYVTLRDGALASDEVGMQPGDVVFGNMTRTGPQSFDIISVNMRTGQQTVQSADNTRLASQPWAYNTLECYGCDGCSTYPTGPSVFSHLSLEAAGSTPVKPHWVVTPRHPAKLQCHEAAVVNTDGSVNINFQ